MPTLTITKSYQDDQVLNAADLDNIIDDIEALLNTDGLNDSNIQSAGITASSKIKSATLTTAKFQDSSVTGLKIAPSAITTAKIATDAVTTAKLRDGELLAENFADTSGLAPVGAMCEFHTFNGTLSIPRGWMVLDGDVVNETNYDAQHGSGAYATDGVVNSPLLGKHLPSKISRYSIGAASTTESGGSAIATVGTASNSLDLGHTHSFTGHTHAATLSQTAEASPSAPFAYAKGGQTTTSGAENVSMNDGLDPIDIRPESIEFVCIMKVI